MNNTTALLDVKQMALADLLTINDGLPATVLMENAGAAVAQVIKERWPPQSVVVLCGPGNNGGDGFVIARNLQIAGWPVRVAKIEDFCHNTLGDATIVVDAIFGAGLSRPLEDKVRHTLQAAANSKLVIVAVDIPSGIMGNSGASLGAVQSTMTVTFFRKKPGHLLFPGRKLCGEIIVNDIGIAESVFAEILPTTFENHPSLWQAALPEFSCNTNKYLRASVLIYGGYPMIGAAKLAAHAAARMGAGMTTIAVPETALPAYTSGLMSVMVKPLSNQASINHLLTDDRFSSFLIGPGAGVNEETKSIALKMLATMKPTVIDADAITVFQECPSDLFNAIAGTCVLTPHEGEFTRVFSATGDKLERARKAAAQSGAIVILKGADTVIASPDGTAVINSNAPATLATAGSGDVLGGIILSLLGQGMQPFLACCAGVWIHGQAANLFGIGLIADDLPSLLPKVRASLTATSP